MFLNRDATIFFLQDRNTSVDQFLVGHFQGHTPMALERSLENRLVPTCNLKVFKLRQGTSIRANVSLSVGLSIENLWNQKSKFFDYF